MKKELTKRNEIKITDAGYVATKTTTPRSAGMGMTGKKIPTKEEVMDLEVDTEDVVHVDRIKAKVIEVEAISRNRPLRAIISAETWKKSKQMKE